MRILTTFLSTLFLFSCHNKVAEKKTYNAQPDTFRQFLKKFTIIDLPFIFRYVDYIENFDLDKMVGIDPKSNDTLYIKADYLDGIKCFGILPDTSKFFSLIFFYPADNYYPMLATYNKYGILLDQTNLIVNGCGGDCGITYCSETGIVNKDLTIYCADSINYEYQCDSLGQPIPNSDIVLINSKIGTLTENGNLNLTDDKHEEIKTGDNN